MAYVAVAVAVTEAVTVTVTVAVAVAVVVAAAAVAAAVATAATVAAVIAATVDVVESIGSTESNSVIGLYSYSYSIHNMAIGDNLIAAVACRTALMHAILNCMDRGRPNVRPLESVHLICAN